MKKIRKGTFETNSSSMHSLVITGEKKLTGNSLKLMRMDLSKLKLTNTLGEILF